MNESGHVLKPSVFLSKMLSPRGAANQKKGRYARYRRLRDDYLKDRSGGSRQALAALIDTTSPIDDVFAAMQSFFDRGHYLATYADVRDRGIDPEFHYILWGWRESRTPSRFFDPIYYRDKNASLGMKDFPLAHYFRYGKPLGQPTDPVSNLPWFEASAPDGSTWDNVRSARRTEETEAVVILPVYKGYNETLTALFRVLDSRGSDRYSVLVVNDASPDERLCAKLENLAASGLFDYHRNSSNKGFVRTINFAIEELSDDLDVVLLNSDAYVFEGWFTRLSKYADDDKSVATVTPLSNNATICSYPLYNADNYKRLELPPNVIDQVAARINCGISVDVPTGVGFCMFIRRAALREVGALDAEAFPLGYGEENDFCMRAAAAGFKNIIAGDVFVYHTGSVSFSSIKEENYRQGQINLSQKHPNYAGLVGAHINADPEYALRRNIDAERLVQNFKGAALFITHKWSGGIDTYLKHKCAQVANEGRACLILRVHDSFRASFEDPLEQGIFVPNLADIDLRSSFDFVRMLIERIGPSLLHINSFAGLEWGFQDKLLSLFSAIPAPRILVGHDYSPISHHYQLLRPDNVYVGLPTNSVLSSWDSMKLRSDCVDVVHPDERQRSFQALFDSGVRLQVPTKAAKEIYHHYFPRTDIEVLPHEDNLVPATMPGRRAEDGVLRIVVLGAIGSHKGSDVLASLAADVKVRSLPIEYHLVGYSNQDEKLESLGVRLWGRYRSEDEAAEKLNGVNADLCLIPSVWPETYCYTLSIAFKQGLPIAVFDIGAQAERVKALRMGMTLPLELKDRPSEMSDVLLATEVQKLREPRG